MDIAKVHNKKYPEFSRDIGADILNLINDDKVTKVQDSLDFVAESLFCEYAYVLDLDKQVLEIYKGFNKRKLTKADGRFYKMKNPDNDGYQPVALLAKVKFDDVSVQYMKDLDKTLHNEE
jgi:hypothetical protein